MSTLFWILFFCSLVFCLPFRKESLISNAAQELISATNPHRDSITPDLAQERGKEDSSIESLFTKLDTLNAKIELQTKYITLQWAINNAEFNRFDCFNKRGDGISSTPQVKDILVAFRLGKGHSIAEYTAESPRYSWSDLEASKAKYREKLSNQIEELTGQKPRIVKEEQGWAIYYS